MNKFDSSYIISNKQSYKIDNFGLFCVPENFRTYELYTLAVEINPNLYFENVPEKFRTQELCTLAIENATDIWVLQYVLEKFKNRGSFNKLSYGSRHF